MLIFVYAAGIIFYIHYKKRQKRKNKDPENNTDNGSTLGSRIDLDNVVRYVCIFINQLNKPYTHVLIVLFFQSFAIIVQYFKVPS